ncbi:MAG TPA: HD domain-containing phosphohydrolase, partial [Bacilli bacterium]|nr:HD domain-containing phosphohydrolase [Bacilli bacterium]
KHPGIGYRITKASPELSSIAEYVLSHHEKWDGSGYPQGLKGQEIPLLSRIISIVDAFDAMTQERSYRPTKTTEEALAEIKACAGTQFDPYLAALFIELMEEDA